MESYTGIQYVSRGNGTGNGVFKWKGFAKIDYQATHKEFLWCFSQGISSTGESAVKMQMQYITY
jgi:hypothetical protein